MSAPFGRRLRPVRARRSLGSYVVLELDDDGPEPAPGQFYMLSAARRWGGGEGQRPYLPRACSVARAGPGWLSFLLEDVGPGTARLVELEAGDELWLLGPLGRGFSEPTRGVTTLLVGGGVGIAPLARFQQIWGGRALLGFRDGAHAPGAALLDGPRVASEDGSAGQRGLVTELLAQALEHGSAEIRACGPPAMLAAVAALARERAVDGEICEEAPMACGFGACYGCVIATRAGYRRVCVDGPVFGLSELA